ncbi:uncharacterized protein LOC125507032 [Triticum urartu]|uniref:uncharacterized protein LOC125507032 n=1 Tax=Triticum urartu TaxID=4572 RepID=UPI0020438D06|nr:uncharacterized protein LOC125507032 [Triticum urartu]
MELELKNATSRCEYLEKENEAKTAELGKALREAREVRSESRAAREEIQQAGEIAARLSTGHGRSGQNVPRALVHAVTTGHASQISCSGTFSSLFRPLPSASRRLSLSRSTPVLICILWCPGPPYLVVVRPQTPCPCRVQPLSSIRATLELAHDALVPSPRLFKECPTSSAARAPLPLSSSSPELAASAPTAAAIAGLLSIPTALVPLHSSRSHQETTPTPAHLSLHSPRRRSPCGRCPLVRPPPPRFFVAARAPSRRPFLVLLLRQVDAAPSPEPAGGLLLAGGGRSRPYRRRPPLPRLLYFDQGQGEEEEDRGQAGPLLLADPTRQPLGVDQPRAHAHLSENVCVSYVFPEAKHILELFGYWSLNFFLPYLRDCNSDRGETNARFFVSSRSFCWCHFH